jgi:hypothetical protein
MSRLNFRKIIAPTLDSIQPVYRSLIRVQEKDYDLDLNVDGKMMSYVLSSTTTNFISVVIYAICFGLIDLPQAFKYTILKLKVKCTHILNL